MGLDSSVHGPSSQSHRSGVPFLLQGIFLTQGSKLRLLRVLHWQAGLYHERHLGSPKRPKSNPLRLQSGRAKWAGGTGSGSQSARTMDGGS